MLVRLRAEEKTGESRCMAVNISERPRKAETDLLTPSSDSSSQPIPSTLQHPAPRDDSDASYALNKTRNVFSNVVEGCKDPVPEEGDNKPVHELGQPQPDCSCDTCSISRHIQATITAISYPGERWPTQEETASLNAIFARDSAEYREARRLTYWHMALAMFGLLSSLAIEKGNEPGDGEMSTSTALISGHFANTNFGRSRF